MAGDLIRSEFGAAIQQEIPRCARDFGWRLGRRQGASTSPMPPAPISEVMVYVPSRVPDVSAIGAGLYCQEPAETYSEWLLAMD